jgi:hypothetical protein
VNPIVRYRIEYSPEAVDHLELFTAREQAIILNAVDRQLANEPLKETRNRKPMRPNPIAPWELRIGRFVYTMTWLTKPQSLWFSSLLSE